MPKTLILRLGPPKPCKIIGFGDIHGPEPYKFIRFGDTHGPRCYKFIRFGDIHAPSLGGCPATDPPLYSAELRPSEPPLKDINKATLGTPPPPPPGRPRSAKLKGPRQILRIRPRIFDRTKPKISGLVPASRRIAILGRVFR